MFRFKNISKHLKLYITLFNILNEIITKYYVLFGNLINVIYFIFNKKKYKENDKDLKYLSQIFQNIGKD